MKTKSAKSPKPKSRRKKSEPIWTTRDGQKIPISQMTDTHLVNSIKLLERTAEAKWYEDVNAGYSALALIQGEMAEMEIESCLRHAEEEGSDVYLPEIYDDMVDEMRKRKIGYLYEKN